VETEDGYTKVEFVERYEELPADNKIKPDVQVI